MPDHPLPVSAVPVSAVPVSAVPVSATLEAEPYRHFAAWFAEAAAREPEDPNAMALATVAADGRPSVRTVLLKGVEPDGFVFYTNKLSRKGVELSTNRHAALLFHWKSLQRQVRIEGIVQDVTDAEADAYFATRARISRLGAIASDQSRPLPDRAVLEQRVAELDARYPEAIPRPAHWSGYRLRPDRMEFWQQMPFRLHDRTVWTQSAGVWRSEKLYP